MKLDRCGWCLAVLVALATGCGPRTSTKPIVCAPKKPAVSTTTLMAAELDGAEETPKVGKSQHTGATRVDDDAKKDVPHRKDERRPGGGFSGYK